MGKKHIADWTCAKCATPCVNAFCDEHMHELEALVGSAGFNGEVNCESECDQFCWRCDGLVRKGEPCHASGEHLPEMRDADDFFPFQDYYTPPAITCHKCVRYDKSWHYVTGVVDGSSYDG